MDRRTLILLVAALSIAAGMIGYSVVWKPWNEKRKKLDAEIAKSNRQLTVAKEFLARKPQIDADWKKMEDALRNPEREYFKGDLISYVRKLVDKVIPDDKRRPVLDMRPQAEQVADFAEWVVDGKNARFHIDEFKNFLIELDSAKEFLKVRSMTYTTKYDSNESVILVDFRLSTIEYAPKAKP